MPKVFTIQSFTEVCDPRSSSLGASGVGLWFSHSEHEPPTNNMVGLFLSYTPKINYMINSKVAYFWLDIKIGWHVLSLSTVSRPKDPAMVGSVPQSVLWVVSGSSLLSQHHGSAH